MELILHTFDLELKYPFTISRRSFDRQKNLIIELRSGHFRGYGEATENSYYPNTAIETMIEQAKQVQTLLKAHSFSRPEKLWHQLYPLLKAYPFVLCAIDVAAHDLYGQIRGLSLRELWGGKLLPRSAQRGTEGGDHRGLRETQRFLGSSFTLSIADKEINVRRMQEMDWPLYKIKLGTDRDVQIIEELRAHSSAPFCVDANCAWTAEQTLQYAKIFKRLGVLFIEQPLPAERDEEMQQLYRESELPLFADESCCTEADVAACVNHFHGINIKLMKCGGLTPARRMVAQARSLGLKVMVGCMTESTIGISAAAQLLPQLDYADLDGALFLKKDIASGVTFTREGVLFPDAPGTGARLIDK